jgi:hypothetical protein
LQVIKETLSPTWDQTLVLWPIIIWSSAQEPTSNLPQVVMEALDQDIGVSMDISHFCTERIISPQKEFYFHAIEMDFFFLIF